ncbi:MAG TPA: hypothetical protein EYO33_21070 [Phycisphaerales bacterium]|nr:hypothetical protein [Phycisphaerales bacterium]
MVKKFPPNKDRSSYLTGEGDQLGWFVPCVPTEDRSAYWGYFAVPQAGVEWWKRLPSSLQGNDFCGEFQRSRDV